MELLEEKYWNKMGELLRDWIDNEILSQVYEEAQMKITKKNNNENESFWRSTREARLKVENWPTWKRKLKVTKFSKDYSEGSADAD